ncbi:hypothetical protein GQ602_004923 [Ophiocordyceps camponoti-floridani]|uniref:Uncharacterized protein n=1 Tax=Ophiocordyceps camponoti-floridani TaxID=2030778 RepID=A0A8H4VCT1_9HYPO|nr:hypothetical protein GQ602_004923 [Ophiocordyceps camponoti-floridani]
MGGEYPEELHRLATRYSSVTASQYEGRIRLRDPLEGSTSTSTVLHGSSVNGKPASKQAYREARIIRPRRAEP